MQPWHVLVVEDTPEHQQILTTILSYHDVTFDVVGSAREALVLLTQHTYSFGLIDLSLPDTDGFLLLAQLKRSKLTADLPCIAVTAYHSDEVAVLASKAGFVGYFSKPIDVATFFGELQRLFSS